jgi:hypothetical protein
MHRVAYDRNLDATCPQCMLSGIMPPDQLEFDELAQKPLGASGKLLDPKGNLNAK